MITIFFIIGSLVQFVYVLILSDGSKHQIEGKQAIFTIKSDANRTKMLVSILTIKTDKRVCNVIESWYALLNLTLVVVHFGPRV